MTLLDEELVYCTASADAIPATCLGSSIIISLDGGRGSDNPDPFLSSFPFHFLSCLEFSAMRNLVRLDDLSPVIRYQPDAWHTGQTSKDRQGYLYSDGGTFMTTNLSGASVSVAWNGTSVTVYGAKRINHGDYTVSLDGAKPRKFSGHKSPGQFGVPLFRSNELNDGPHTIAITDASSAYLDIDWVEIETQVGETATRLEDDDATSFRYSPQQSWQTTSSHIASFSGNSGHVTSIPESLVEITFSGDAIDIFGLVCPECGSFSVRIDGDAVEGTFSAHSDLWTKPQTMLYFARNLDEGTHRVELTSRGPGILAVDYAVAHSRATEPIDDGSGSVSPQSPRRVPAGVIVGAVLGGLALLLLLALCTVILLRRRKRDPMEVHPSTPLPPFRQTGAQERPLTAYSTAPSPPSRYEMARRATSPPPYQPSSSRYSSPARVSFDPVGDNPLKRSFESSS